MIRLRISARQMRYAKARLDSRGNRGVVVQTMIYHVFGNPRRDNDGRDSPAILFERKAAMVVFAAERCIAGRDSRRGERSDRRSRHVHPR